MDSPRKTPNHQTLSSQTRRQFLERLPLMAACPALGSLSPSAVPKRLAAVLVGYVIRWHGDNIVTRLMEGYWINQTFYPPRCRISSLYTHAVPSYDVGRRAAEAHGVEVFPSIREALCLGSDQLGVDGIVVVAESPPVLYSFDQNPYREFLEQIVGVFRQSGRSVPVFIDKHFSSRWDESKWIYDQASELEFPLMGGSTIPITHRRPPLDVPLETEFEDALVVASIPGAHIQSISFHALELLQSLVERRKGGESGVRSLQFLEGEAVWKAAEEGLWSRELFDAAVARSTKVQVADARKKVTAPMAILLHYNDGFRAAVVGAAGLVSGFTLAAKIRGRPDPLSTLAYYVSVNANSFSCLVRYAEDFFITGHSANPVERTLLASGLIDFIMRSRERGHKLIETPELAIAYRGPKKSAVCEGPGS